MPVLGTPTTKCPHGIFKGREEKARYCSFCNPDQCFSMMPRTVRLDNSGYTEEHEVPMIREVEVRHARA